MASQETAYITGGASGLGLATAHMLAKNHNIKVFIADRDGAAAERAANEIGGLWGVVDTAEWGSQVKCFTQAVSKLGGRIDYVYPIAGVGERRWLPANTGSGTTGPATGLEFEMPDLSVLDIDLNGVLLTAGLAIQQFRRQDVGPNGFRGKSKQWKSFLFPRLIPTCCLGFVVVIFFQD